MRRIGILAEGFMAWGGGIDFLNMICDCLRLTTDKNPPTLLLLARHSNPASNIRSLVLPWYQWISGSYRQRRLKPWRNVLDEQKKLSWSAQLTRLKEAIGGDLPVRYFRDDEDLDAMAQKEKLDCLLPSFRPLSKGVRTPWIGYLYDFQHRHLPLLFAPAEREAREENFQSMARNARYVIVNSQAVRDDCVRFLGSAGASFVALPFGAAANPDWLTAQPALLAKYKLPPRYFLVSNQFWTHKNHRVVFEALRTVAQTPEIADVVVVCTGSIVDERDRTYFPSLLQFLEDNRLDERVRILDYIPKRDQIEIMKQAIAVIQPTLFEGGPGGGAVYDAVSLGVPALVSDIPVNRELESQDFPIQFFEPANAQALASFMLDLARQPKARKKDATTLMEEGLGRRQAVGSVIATTIQAARASRGVD